MSGNPIVGEKVIYTAAFPDQPDQPARLKSIEDERRGIAQVELLGGPQDGQKLDCIYDETGKYACSWHREGEPEMWAADRSRSRKQKP